MERFSHVNPFESHFLRAHEVKSHQIQELARNIENHQFLFFPFCPLNWDLSFRVESCEVTISDNLNDITYTLRLRDHRGAVLLFNQEAKSKFAFSGKINSIWPVAEQFLDFYFEDYGIEKIWKAFLQEKIENPDTTPMYPKQIDAYTAVDKESLRNFVDKLSFMVTKVLTKVKNSNGTVWKLVKGDKDRFQICYKKNQESLHIFRLQRRRLRRQIACFIENETGALLAHIGCEKIIQNPDVREENLKFYQQFGNMSLISNPKHKTLKKSASIELKKEQQLETEKKFIQLFRKDSKFKKAESTQSKLYNIF
jgi:hypothetical protein